MIWNSFVLGEFQRNKMIDEFFTAAIFSIKTKIAVEWKIMRQIKSNSSFSP